MVGEGNLLSFEFFFDMSSRNSHSKLALAEEEKKKKLNEKQNVQCMQHRGQGSDARCPDDQVVGEQ